MLTLQYSAAGPAVFDAGCGHRPNAIEPGLIMPPATDMHSGLEADLIRPTTLQLFSGLALYMREC